MRRQPSGPTDAAVPAVPLTMNAAAFVQTFFGRAAVGVGLTRQGRIVYSNPALQSLLGYSGEELAGMDFTEFTHPEDIPAGYAPEDDRSPDQPDYWRQEKRYLTKEGHVIWARVVLSGLPESVLGEQLSLLMVEDITARRRAEEALLQSEKRYRQMVESAHDWIWEVDEDARYTLASPKILEILGYKPEEVLGKTPFDLMPPEEAQRVMARFGPIPKPGESFFSFENVNLHKDGHLVAVETTGVPVLDENGVFRGYTGVDRDITERRRAEEALRQSEARQRQSQKMEAIGRLAGGIAHDFNNLLTTIIGYTDLMMSDFEFEGTRWFEDMQEIKAAAERAGGLTQQILAFSRRQRLQTEVISVNSLVTEIAPLLRRTMGEDIELVTHLDPDVGLVDVDPQQFTQSLMNLAVNARDAMPSGGQLTFSTNNVWLDEHSPNKDPDTAPGSYARVAVSDSGVGIEPSALPLIYEPFYTTKPPGQGTGLGLPSVYGVVKQSGGAITVESIPGEGTTFEIFLPRAKDAQSPQPSDDRPDDKGVAPEASPQQRVLVVEDEEAVRKLTERILKQLGYAVESAANGPDALAILHATKDFPIDLLLTDVVLPGGLDGGEIARRAKALRNDLAVLYVSGYSRNAVLDSVDAEASVHYLEKPFTAEQLALKVRDALEAAKGRSGKKGTWLPGEDSNLG